MNPINKDKLLREINYYIDNKDRQKIFRDNPIILNMFNEILSICENEEVISLVDLNIDDLQLIEECLLASAKVCETVKSKRKASSVYKTLDKVICLIEE